MTFVFLVLALGSMYVVINQNVSAAGPPTITSITSDATFLGTLKVDDTILFTLTPGSAEPGATVNGTYNTQTLIWSTTNNGDTYTV